MWLLPKEMPCDTVICFFAEHVVRAAVGYAFLLVAFRLTGKRQVGQMTPFDLVVLLIISNVLQNAMIGPDDSIAGGVVGALTIFVLNHLVAKLSYSRRWLERLLDGKPTLLVHNGRVDPLAMKAELVTRAELHAALRDAGIASVSDARFVMLESTGHMTAASRRKE